MQNTNIAIILLGIIVIILFGAVVLTPSPQGEVIVNEAPSQVAEEATPSPEQTQEIPQTPSEVPQIPAQDSVIVVIETSKGNIEVELDSEHAPATVENFLVYVDEGFYSGTVFHRVIDGFMVQGGGFTANGSEKATHNPIKLESNNGLKNTRGTIAMARTNYPHSATSQFFINVVDNSFLDYSSAANPGYAAFGRVISGMDVVDQIKSVPVTTKHGMENWPAEEVEIIKIYRKEN